ncbi:MAG: D-Ala-D-Ala carboxypeptidase family metallohydrolase [Gammaproteobacteria bacterium]|nr:D-Ala-D-Ala carboxypeptidase family metallohydrolase [Gammaproteobacteria bacterium]
MRKAAVVALATLMASCAAPAPSPETRYQRWLAAGHRQDALQYRAYLQRESAADAVPLDALLRTSRRWRICLHDEFSIPTRELWRNMPPTLRVVRELRDAGMLDPALARSVYRNEAVNRCAGGSAGSKHRENRAIDFDLPPHPDNIARLCAFWRARGPELKLGLGFYTPTAIHLDTAGFRTWGSDHRRGTSLCLTQRNLQKTFVGATEVTTKHGNS